MTMLAVPSSLTRIEVSGDPQRWSALGFTVDSGVIGFGNGSVVMTSASTSGIVGLAVASLPGGVERVDFDGVEVRAAAGLPAASHPNGATELDHLVLMTPDLDRSSRHAAAVLGLRRLRLRETDTVRQAFHRFADVTRPDGSVVRGCILELVERPDVERPALWGLVVITERLDEISAGYPDAVSSPRDAVQPGRRIATVRRDARLTTAVAFMDR